MENEIIVCAPSYKRPTKCDVLQYLPNIWIYVSEQEEMDYRRANPTANIHSVPARFQGNVCRIRNRILDENPNKTVCIVDDDLRHVGYHENRIRHEIGTETDFHAFLNKYTIVAIELGVRLWGINVSFDKQNYREYTPFSLTSYIGSPFMVHINPVLAAPIHGI